ncbi:846_t:CDS:2 [Rhizophagus irregularis]|nr:846_t:CDS:2 [Rhizophagus irregularis]
MNTQSLSSNDKGLLTKLSQNNETTIVSNNNAYFKGNFYEKKNNEWVDSDLNEFTKILNAESFFVNVEDDIEIFEEFSGFQKVLEEFEIKIKIGNILDILNNRSKAKSCVKRKWQVCDIGPSYLLDIKNEKWDELLKELNIENIEESDNDEDV